MGQKKIILTVDIFFELRATTGISTYINHLMSISEAEAKVHGVEIKYAPSVSAIKGNLFFKKDKALSRRFFHVVYHIWKQLILPVWAKQLKTDVLLCPDYICPKGKTSFLKVPVIHSSFFWEYPENYSRRWRSYYLQMMQAGLKQYQKALTTSIYTQKKLAHFLPDIACKVVYQAPKLLAKNHSSPKIQVNAPYILHVGAFDRRKNLKTLVLGFSKLKKEGAFKDIRLVLVGGRSTPNNDMTDELHLLANELNLTKDVVFTGHVDDETLWHVYNKASLYVFPSMNEGFGIPILEAFQSKTPVVVSDSGSLAEVGGDAVEVFSTYDADDLVEKMKKSLSDSFAQQSIAKGMIRLQKFSRETFSRDVMDSIKELYEENKCKVK